MMDEITFRLKRPLRDEEFKRYLSIVRKISTFNRELKAWVYDPGKALANLRDRKELEYVLKELKKYVGELPEELIIRRYVEASREPISLDPLTLEFSLPHKVPSEGFKKLIRICEYEKGVFRLKDPRSLNELRETLEGLGFKVLIDEGPGLCRLVRERGHLKICFERWGLKAAELLRRLESVCTLRYFIERPRFDEEGNFLGSEMLERRINTLRVLRDERCVLVPMGLLDKVLRVIEESGLRVKLNINELPSLKLKMEKKFSLLPHQEVAYKLWSKKRRGTIAIFTRGGKSFVAMEAIYELKKPTVIFVTTRELASTWREYLHRYLGLNPHLIGYLGEGERKLRPITVAIYNSAVKYLNSLKDSFELAIFDECLTPDTLIVKSDGVLVPIGELVKEGKEADLFVGGKCLGFLERSVDEIVEILTDTGLIKTTLTHPHLVLRAGYRDAESRVRVPEVVLAKDLKVGDYLLVAERIPHVSCYGASFPPPGKVVSHEYLVRRASRAPLSYVRKLLRELFDKGEAFFDEELELLSPPMTWRLFNVYKLLLMKMGIQARVRLDEEGVRLVIVGSELGKFVDKIGKPRSLRGERVERALRAAPSSLPAPKMRVDNLTFRLSPIRHIKAVKGWFKVYDMSTQRHLFVADGFLTHNCHHVPANTFKDVAMGIGALYRMALSATPKRRDGNEGLLFSLCGDLLLSIDYRQLLKMKIVAPIEVFKTMFVRGEEEKVKEVVKILNQWSESKALIFTQYLQSAEKLYRELLSKGFKVSLVTGNTPSAKRKRAFEEFVKGTSRAIVTTTVLDEGVTVPDADLAIIYEGSGEARQMIQRIGRVIGYSPGKTAKIYELVDILDPKEKRAYFKRKWIREIYNVDEEDLHRGKRGKLFIQYKIDYWNED